MHKIIPAAIGVIALGAASAGAFAYSKVFSSEAGAQTTCPGSEVVWIDLNRSLYYHKTQPEFGKSGGAYACVTAARDRGYRESKPIQQEAAKPD